MAEMPFHLKRFVPVKGALDILRYLGAVGDELPDADDLIDEIGLSDRAFSKAIRRLVTLSYVQMSPDGLYSLTPNGEKSIVELRAFDEANDGSSPAPKQGKIQRRLLVALPRTLVAKQSAPLLVGFHPADEGGLAAPADLVLRVDAIHGELSNSNDEMVRLDNAAFSQDLAITAGTHKQVRVRVQVMQLSPNGDDVNKCGGMYVDVDVESAGEPGQMTAYGAVVELDPTG